MAGGRRGDNRRVVDDGGPDPYRIRYGGPLGSSRSVVVILSLTGFVSLYLRAGRRWLAWAICALRTFSLALNFLVGQNLNYLEINGHGDHIYRRISHSR